MLNRLSVRNMAVIESADVDFCAGLNVITGETGAGKSVLMGALGLILGARADSALVREGAKDARVEAEFAIAEPAALNALLDAVGLPPCEDGTLIVRRIVNAAGGGRVQINDSPATVQTLRAAARLLGDMHGPDDRLALAEENFQRAALDAFGKISPAAYRAEWERLAQLRRERDELTEGGANVGEEIERLEYAVGELDSAALTAEDDTDLPARHAAAAHAAEILESAGAAGSLLADGDESAATALIAAAARLRETARYHEAAAEWADEAQTLTMRVQELARTVGDAVSRIDADPQSLQELDERLSLVSRLKRKYGCTTVEELLELREKRAARLEQLAGRDARLAQLDGEIAAQLKAVCAKGADLLKARAAAGKRLAKTITAELRGLGFLQAGFAVSVAKAEPAAHGCDRVEFLFEPNPGEPPRPLKDIASTGEIARVMLALKSVIAERDSIPLLVFDEIDSNIGGETGRAVGERLRDVARHHQVVAITHLPQSAVYGERHFAVAKTVQGGRTHSTVAPLEGERRVAEISRMLGGAELTSVVERHARELLAVAEAR